MGPDAVEMKFTLLSYANTCRSHHQSSVDAGCSTPGYSSTGEHDDQLFINIRTGRLGKRS